MRGRAGRLVGCPEGAQRAGDVDDDRVLRLLQQWERRLRHPDDADGVRVEHLEHAGAVQGLAVAAAHGDAGVVDEHVQPGVRRGDRRERGGDRVVVGDVERDEAGAELVGGGPAAGLVAGADPDGVPGLDEQAGGFLAEAPRSSRRWLVASAWPTPSATSSSGSRAWRARARPRADAPHRERAAPARPLRRHPTGRLRRRVEPAGRQRALRRAHGRHVRVAGERPQRGRAQRCRARVARTADTAGARRPGHPPRRRPPDDRGALPGGPGPASARRRPAGCRPPVRRPVGERPGPGARRAVPAQGRRPPGRRPDHAGLRHPRRGGRRPADHGLHGRAGDAGRRAARPGGRPRHAGARRLAARVRRARSPRAAGGSRAPAGCARGWRRCRASRRSR